MRLHLLLDFLRHLGNVTKCRHDALSSLPVNKCGSRWHGCSVFLLFTILARSVRLQRALIAMVQRRYSNFWTGVGGLIDTQRKESCYPDRKRWMSTDNNVFAPFQENLRYAFEHCGGFSDVFYVRLRIQVEVEKEVLAMVH